MGEDINILNIIVKNGDFCIADNDGILILSNSLIVWDLYVKKFFLPGQIITILVLSVPVGFYDKKIILFPHFMGISFFGG